MRTKYRFTHVSDDGQVYHWESVGVRPVIHTWCSRKWFWDSDRTTL